MNFPAQGEPLDTQIKRTAIKVKQFPPNKEWSLGMLSTFDNQNELFGKSYVKPKVDARGNEVPDLDTVDNRDDFFTGLPVAKKSKKRNVMVFTDKGVSRQAQLAKKQKQAEKLQADIARLNGLGPIPVEVQAVVQVEERKNGRVPNIIGNQEDENDEDVPVQDAS